MDKNDYLRAIGIDNIILKEHTWVLMKSAQLFCLFLIFSQDRWKKRIIYGQIKSHVFTDLTRSILKKCIEIYKDH